MKIIFRNGPKDGEEGQVTGFVPKIYFVIPNPVTVDLDGPNEVFDPAIRGHLYTPAVGSPPFYDYRGIEKFE